MKIKLSADIGVVDSLYAGDVFTEIARQMSELAKQCYSLGDLDSPAIPRYATIEHPDGELVGYWEIKSK